MDQEDQGEDLGPVLARAWSDEAFKAKLLSDPHAALAEMGVEVSEGVTVKVVEDTDTFRHLVLPPKPGKELTNEELGQAELCFFGSLLSGAVPLLHNAFVGAVQKRIKGVRVD